MARANKDSFYRRDARKALRGMLSLTLEEAGVYGILIDLMYDTWRPLPFDSDGEKKWVIGWIPAAAQKVNPILRRLIEKGRVRLISIAGKDYLTDDAFEAEMRDFKGVDKWAEIYGEPAAKSAEVSEKSEDVEEKSPLLDPQNEENQSLAGAEENKNRIEKKQSKKRRGALSTGPVDNGRRWPGDVDGHMRRRLTDRHGVGWVISYFDNAGLGPGGSLVAATTYAFGKLVLCDVLRQEGIRVEPPPKSGANRANSKAA